MQSRHFIDLEDSASPSYYDDIDFFDMMFSKILCILSNTSSLAGWNNDTSSITKLSKIKKLDDFNELYLRDDNTNSIMEVNYNEWEKTYSIEITIPDKFNSKYVEMKNAPEQVINRLIKQQFPKIKLPKKGEE